MNIKSDNLCRATIFSGDEDTYGHKYREHFFQQYKLFVESVNYTSDLKLKLNTFFLTVNTALVTAIGIGFSSEYHQAPHHPLLGGAAPARALHDRVGSHG
ncbi:MAG: hypothetical protein Q7R59_01195 [bacterium]|nr:hypothetical protein [bacterium]